MEILIKHTPCGFPDAAVFDFDGTLSSLRAGWEAVMGGMMRELIPGDPAEVSALVDRYIDESTGIQTIHQMRWLAEEIARRTGTSDDPWDYKAEYNRRLMLEVQTRRDDVRSGKVPAAYWRVPGGEDFLAALRERGVTMYAASGTDDADVKAEARILGLDRYFAEIAGAGQGTDACSKEAVLRRLVKPGRRLLVVGDGRVEIALGRETGALTLGIASMDTPGGTPAGMNRIKYERLKKAGAHAIAADFSEREALLQWI